MKKLALIATLLILALPMVISSLVSASPGTLTIRPNAVGTYSEWIPSAGANWECVDEVTPDTDTYVETNTANARDSYNLTDHTAETETITNVRVYVRALSVQIDRTINLGVVIGGTPYEAAAAKTLTTSYADYYDDWPQNPATSALWTWTDIDNLEASFRAVNPHSSKAMRVTTVWVEVTYAPTMESYEDSGCETACNDFTAAKTQVWMKAIDLSPGAEYKTAFYDATVADGGAFVAEYINSAVGTTLTATYNFYDVPTAVGDGDWHAVVFYPSTTEAPGTYDLASAHASKVVEDVFWVTQEAIPEFPTVIAGLVVAGTCFGIYYWMRKRRLAHVKA